MTKHHPPASSPIPLVPLLITESEEEFNRIRQALYDELGPVGIVEQMYVDEVVDLVWQILRLKRCKAGVINLAFHQSSASILYRLMQAGPDVAREWISNPKIAKKVEAELATYKLDGSIIIAHAIQQSLPRSHRRPARVAWRRRGLSGAHQAQYRGDLGAMHGRHRLESQGFV